MDNDLLFKNQAFGDDSCFLCGSKVAEITKEHVIPKWLLKKHKLWDKRLSLLNNTKIPYRLLTIPCCAACNNQSLSHLELKVRNVISEGYSACVNLSSDIWYLWIAKIFYGILRKEIMLKKDRSGKSIETIIEPTLLANFKSIHLFLQQIKEEHSFSGTRPYSLFLVNLHVEKGDEFFLMDSIYDSTILLRVGSIGIICALQDAEISLEKYGWYLQQVDGNKLHSIQIHELYAYISYTSRLMSHSPTYYTYGLHTESSKIKKITTTTSYNGIFEEWKREEFIGCLSIALNCWIEGPEDLIVDGERINTWMTDKNGKPQLLSYEEWQSLKKIRN
jgi:hypothetical protein